MNNPNVQFIITLTNHTLQDLFSILFISLLSLTIRVAFNLGLVSWRQCHYVPSQIVVIRMQSKNERDATVLAAPLFIRLQFWP